MTCKPRVLIAAAVASAALAGTAAGQQLDLRLPEPAAGPAPEAVTLSLAGAPAKAVPDLANPLDPIARPRLQPNAVDSAVFARTAVDHRFGPRSDLTGALGFLCGLQPGHGDTGGAAAYGVDPHGRFVGAKFSIAFK